MTSYTLEEIKDFIIFESLMGSHAYGTTLPTSDRDIRGVFIQPLQDILTYGYVEQVSDEKNDICFYELRRFLNLCENNNPNILELLFAPEDCILKTSEEWEMIRSHRLEFLTKRCRYTFAGYAIEQIKKARGFNKKMNWEESEMTRKNVLDFCYILIDGGSMSLHDWLVKFNEEEIDRFDQRDFGLVNIDHCHDVYAMYLLSGFNIPKGIVSDINKANDIQLCSVPKGLEPVGYLTFNKDGYSSHCARYKEYQTWLKERNPDRVKMNKEHGKNYDSKNMMHTFRLLKVALEIAHTGNLIVRRPTDELDILMQIRRGTYEFDDLISEAESMIKQLDAAYEFSNLPSKIDETIGYYLLWEIRKKRYGL